MEAEASSAAPPPTMIRGVRHEAALTAAATTRRAPGYGISISVQYLFSVLITSANAWNVTGLSR